MRFNWKGNRLCVIKGREKKRMYKSLKKKDKRVDRVNEVERSGAVEFYR